MSTAIRQAVIPCAGFGTRLLPATKCVPKELFPVLNKPAIQYVVEELLCAGITQMIFVENPAKLSVATHFAKNDELENFLRKMGKEDHLQELRRIESAVTFNVAIQKEPRGLGDAILSAREWITDGQFVVALPDVIFSHEALSTAQLLATCREQDRPGLTLVHVPLDQSRLYGMVWGQAAGKLFMVEGATEKPEPQNSPSDLAIVGRYVLPKTIFEVLARSDREWTGEIELTKVLHQLAAASPLAGVVEDRPIFDVGTLQGMVDATAYFAKNHA